VRGSIELVCFDLDGTLVDSAPDLCTALGHALNATGFSAPSEAQTRSWIGDGVEKLLSRALRHAGAQNRSAFPAALEAFHASYSRSLFDASRLYPGVETTLEQLCDSGLVLCCITNKRTEYATELLQQARIADRFAFVFGGDTFPQKKPHPRQLHEAAQRAQCTPARCAMIGDSDTDSMAAAAAGAAFVWAAFGYSAALSSREPDTVVRINEFAEVPAALAALMPAA